MKQKLVRRLLCLMLAAVLLPGLMPAAQAAEDDITASVESQIRAYADSVDQSDAVNIAAAALAVHGISMGGKKLSVGEGSSLTAVLMNSELLQAALRDTFVAALDYMHLLNMDTLSAAVSSMNWNDSDRNYLSHVFLGDVLEYEKQDQELVRVDPYTGKLNSYDDALEWMAGGANLKLKITRKTVAEETVTYEVNCTVTDKFDFDTSSNAGFKKWMSGLGALLFEEFEWETKVTFELTVPRQDTCNHSYRSYHWSYDAENSLMNNDASDGFAENEATQYSAAAENSAEGYYYGLQEPVRLLHDKPWVLEYRICNPGYFSFAPLDTAMNQQPHLVHNSGQFLVARYYENVLLSDAQIKELGITRPYQRRVHDYGTEMNGLFSYSKQQTYTIRLENRLQANGSNMVYVTVYDENRDVILNVPMDDYYLSESWGEKRVLKSTESNGISGRDFVINFIGNQSFCFSADYFDLRIWENGEGSMTESAFFSRITKSTCAEQGYTTYTCTLCGYSYKGDYTAANGHSYGPWYTVTEAACAEAGQERRDCDNCDAWESREISASGHAYAWTVTPPACTEQGYTTYVCDQCGDSYVGNYVDAIGHDYHGEVTAPDCTEGGCTTYTCAVCAHSYVSDHTDPLGHSYGQWVVTREPTEQEEGVKMRTCLLCGHEEEQSIPVLNNPFTDVKEGKYYYKPVLWAVEQGITSGTGATTFAPDLVCTRAQVVTFLWRAMGSPEPELTENPFSDVKEGAFYYKAVLWAVENGITSGTDATHFSPETACTRGQVATFLWRTMGKPEPSGSEHPFKDLKEGAFYGQAVLWAVESGITTGTGPDKFEPDSSCTRAQIVTFLYRAMA